MNDPAVLMQGGLEPNESDPRFHQQMVYAVSMRTLENFERALGRRLSFARPSSPCLRLIPHAFFGANAYFDPKLNAILFGYFRADSRDPGRNIPGQNVFSCLSHDIIAHELTHAIVHRLRPYFLDPSNHDCGSIKRHEVAIRDIVDQVIADVTDGDGTPRIDVVIATHRHRDHLIGFDNRAWSRVEVKEVWLPWTEDPRDARAREIREGQARLAIQLPGALLRLESNPDLVALAMTRYRTKAPSIHCTTASREARADGSCRQPIEPNRPSRPRRSPA